MVSRTGATAVSGMFYLLGFQLLVFLPSVLVSLSLNNNKTFHPTNLHLQSSIKMTAFNMR
jgi:hypothetical protein